MIKIMDTVTATELYALSPTPEFAGQTRVVNNEYWMLWVIDGKQYRTNHKLHPKESDDFCMECNAPATSDCQYH